jgi:hypothetical protein
MPGGISGGSGGGTVAPWNPSVSVATTTTLGSGGSPDWWGRASVKRRPSDNALVLVYYRASSHTVNGGALHIKFNATGAAGDWTAQDTALASDGGGAITGFPLNPPDLSGSQDAGEPWLYVCPNGDLLIHMWKVDYGGSNAGSWQSRSTDGGLSWSTPTQISWVGGSLSSTDTFQTDDDFVFDQTIYAGIRTYNGPSYTDCYLSLVKSADNGATWEYVSDVTGPSETACIEYGMEYVGNSTIVAMIRDLAHTASYQRVSTDMGATWGTLTEVTSTVGIAARQRVYTGMHLRGEAGWWKDPNLVMVGYIQTVPGDSQGRRNAVWFSPDRGTTWSGPHYVDTDTEDAGYGDIFWDFTNQRYSVVNYDGTLTAAALKQYDLTVDLTG